MGRRAITLAGVSVAGVLLLVLAFALNAVEPADSYTDSWAQLVWGMGIWACGIGAVVTGFVPVVRHHERSWTVALATLLVTQRLTVPATLGEIWIMGYLIIVSIRGRGPAKTVRA